MGTPRSGRNKKLVIDVSLKLKTLLQKLAADESMSLSAFVYKHLKDAFGEGDAK